MQNRFGPNRVGPFGLLQPLADGVKMLIKDVANWDRSDRMFPFLRNYDPYAGHSWAGGSSGGWGGWYRWGADQEASGEDMNFASAVFLWGLNTQDNQLRDLGLFARKPPQS